MQAINVVTIFICWPYIQQLDELIFCIYAKRQSTKLLLFAQGKILYLITTQSVKYHDKECFQRQVMRVETLFFTRFFFCVFSLSISGSPLLVDDKLEKLLHLTAAN